VTAVFDDVASTFDHATTTTFDRTTAVTFTGEAGRYDADLSAAWASLRGVHGGYLTAIAVRAAQAELTDREVRTVTTSFLRAGKVGPAAVTVTPVRAGRLVAVVEVSIVQEHGEILRSRITATAPTEGSAWDVPTPIDLPPIEQCAPTAPPPDIRHFDHCEAFLDPADLPFSHQEHARLAGYVRPRETRPLDAAFLAMLLDWFPPSPFVRTDPPTGGVSVDYTVHLHRTLPALGDDEWLRGRFEVRHSIGGLALEQGIVATADGTVVAESFHTRLTG
jgi:acyl-CoA thioesterase